MSMKFKLPLTSVFTFIPFILSSFLYISARTHAGELLLAYFTGVVLLVIALVLLVKFTTESTELSFIMNNNKGSYKEILRFNMIVGIIIGCLLFAACVFFIFPALVVDNFTNMLIAAGISVLITVFLSVLIAYVGYGLSKFAKNNGFIIKVSFAFSMVIFLAAVFFASSAHRIENLEPADHRYTRLLEADDFTLSFSHHTFNNNLVEMLSNHNGVTSVDTIRSYFVDISYQDALADRITAINDLPTSNFPDGHFQEYGLPGQLFVTSGSFLQDMYSSFNSDSVPVFHEFDNDFILRFDRGDFGINISDMHRFTDRNDLYDAISSFEINVAERRNVGAVRLLNTDRFVNSSFTVPLPQGYEWFTMRFSPLMTLGMRGILGTVIVSENFFSQLNPAIFENLPFEEAVFVNTMPSYAVEIHNLIAHYLNDGNFATYSTINSSVHQMLINQSFIWVIALGFAGIFLPYIGMFIMNKNTKRNMLLTANS